MEKKFLVDAELGKLAKWLRIMGYDAHYQPFYNSEHIRAFAKQRRVLLTRNAQRLLQWEGAVFLRPDRLNEQLQQLKQEGLIAACRSKWFSRCVRCNRPLLEAEPEVVTENVPEYVFLKNPSGILFCPSCNRFFWPGSHRQRKIDIGRLSPAFPVTPPGVRVRTGRFGGLSYRLTVNLGIPSESK
jgi:uncharacterized protein